MKLYSRDSNPIAKATISLVHDTNAAFDCQLYRVKAELGKGRACANFSYALAQLEEAEKRIKGVVDMLYKAVKEAPEPVAEPAPTTTSATGMLAAQGY